MAAATPDRVEKLKGLGFVGVTMALWGVLAVFLKFALQYGESSTIAWFRFASATGIMLLVSVFWKRQKPGRVIQPRLIGILKKPPLLGLIAGASLAGNYFGYMKGVELTSPSNTNILIQCGPLMLGLVGVFVFKEKLAKSQMLGLGIAIAGFSLFFRDQLQHLFVAREQYVSGNFWIFFAAATWVIWAAFQKYLQKKWRPQALNFLTYAVATIVLLPIVQWADFESLPPIGWAIFLFLGLNTLLAYGALAEALHRLPANQVSVLITLNPVITLLVMAQLTRLQVSWIDPENITASGYFGAAVLLVGVALVVFKK